MKYTGLLLAVFYTAAALAAFVAGRRESAARAPQTQTTAGGVSIAKTDAEQPVQAFKIAAIVQPEKARRESPDSPEPKGGKFADLLNTVEDEEEKLLRREIFNQELDPESEAADVLEAQFLSALSEMAALEAAASRDAHGPKWLDEQLYAIETKLRSGLDDEQYIMGRYAFHLPNRLVVASGDLGLADGENALQPGDIIYLVNGRQVYDLISMRMAIAKAGNNRRLAVDLFRDGNLIQLSDIAIGNIEIAEDSVLPDDYNMME